MKKKPRNHDRAEDQTILTASIPVKMKEDLKAYAYETDSDVSKIIRKMIRESLEEYGYTSNPPKK